MATYRMRSVRLEGNSTIVEMELLEGDSYELPKATTAEIGGVKMATFQNNSTATDVAGVVSDLNSLLGKLRTSGALETPNS